MSTTQVSSTKSSDGWGLNSDGWVMHNDMSNHREVKFSDKAPEWRRISQGLNIEARCATSSCEAFKKRVWTKVESNNDTVFGDINLIERICTVVCPICGENTPEDSVYGIGFYNCKYSFRGKIHTGGAWKRKQEGYDASWKHRVPLTARVTNGFVLYEGTDKIQFWKFVTVNVDRLDKGNA